MPGNSRKRSGKRAAARIGLTCKAIDFTFAVEKGGQTVLSAEHHWDVAAQTDHVKWKDKDVTVNLADPGVR